MTTEQKIIRTKVGLLELGKQLGNVSQACQVMGYIRFASAHSKASAGSINCVTNGDCQITSHLYTSRTACIS